MDQDTTTRGNGIAAQGLAVVVERLPDGEDLEHLATVPTRNIPPSPVGASVSPAQRPFGPTGLAQPPAQTGQDPEVDGAVFLVLVTTGDTVLDRLRAGEAASAVLLAATRAGLSTTPFSQAVEVDASRLRLGRDVLGVPEHPQLVLRVGRPAAGAAPIPATPRRQLGSVLLDRG